MSTLIHFCVLGSVPYLQVPDSGYTSGYLERYIIGRFTQACFHTKQLYLNKYILQEIKRKSHTTHSLNDLSKSKRFCTYYFFLGLFVVHFVKAIDGREACLISPTCILATYMPLSVMIIQRRSRKKIVKLELLKNFVNISFRTKDSEPLFVNTNKVRN